MRQFAHRLTLWLVSVLLVTAPAAGSDGGTEDLEFFEKQVRPVLVEHCLKCHGLEKQEAGLRLDSREATLKGGDSGPAVETGKPDESLLIEAIGYEGDIKMPPKKKLPEEAIAALTEWVRRGAPWPAEKAAGKIEAFDLEARRAKQWAFQPVVPRELPAASDPRWPQSSIDHFVLAKLEAAGLKPAPRADKRALLRRVTYDLIGLPPTPPELDAFVADESPQAFEKVVNRLLDSPHYGERWARHWLDLVRYAETMGHEFDIEIPHASEYRDYVIRAFNADVPYDQFVVEQIAGDLLPQPRRHPTEGFNESIIGTGFWFLGESKHSPVDVRADEAERADNQIDVLGKTFFAQTLGCARCHDHKFDALSTKDYYALKGYLQSSRMQIACVDPPEERLAVVAELRKLRDERAALLATQSVVAAGSQAATREGDVAFVDFAVDDFRDWIGTGEAFGDLPLRDARLVFAQPGRGWPAGARGLAHSGALAGKLEGVLRSKTFTIEKSHVLYLAAGQGARIDLIIDNYHHLRNPIYGGLTVPLQQPDKLQWFSQDVSKWIGHNAYVELIDEGAGFLALERIVFSDGGAPALPESPALASDEKNPDTRLTELAEKQRQLEARIEYRRKVLAIADGTGEDDHVHLRGNPNRFGDAVPRRFLEAVAGLDQPAPERGSGRLELARRMVAPSNPLFARVIVNRLWKHHFGEGLVRTPDDFGNMGQPPTHPELLDFLATTLVQEKWSLKSLHRLMVLSSTYQMSSCACEPQAEEADPQNKLWHRMNLRRLEAEAIRDGLLAVSGRLNRSMYGPGVLPYLTSFMVGRGRPGSSGPLDGDGRRSIYINARRNFLTPMFLAFDYPVPFATIGRRSVSNVPAQALALMNNPFVLQQAEVWAQRVTTEHATSEERIRAMYRAAFARDADAGEIAEAQAFLAEQLKQHPADEPLRAWADFAHVLFNVKEFLYID